MKRFIELSLTLFGAVYLAQSAADEGKDGYPPRRGPGSRNSPHSDPPIRGPGSRNSPHSDPPIRGPGSRNVKGFLYENLIDRMDVPLLKIDLDDGNLEYVKLFKYNPFKEISISRKSSCFYLGSLANDESSSVAVTGCPGDDDVQITLISNSVRGQYQLDSRGEMVEIESPWNNDATSKVLKFNREWTQNGDEIFNPDIEAAASNAAQYCSVNTNSASCNIPASHKMTLKIHYDSSLNTKLDDPLTWISNVMTHTQAFLNDPTLPTKITLEPIGSPIYHETEKWFANVKSIQAVRSFAQGDTTADLHTFFCFDTNKYHGTVGIAYVGGLCDTNGYQVSINEWRDTVAGTAKVTAHEFGHNFGMSHDFDSKHSGKGCTGIMDYGTTPNTWSSCSQSDFKDHYEAIFFNTQSHCLEVTDEGSNPPNITTTTTTTTQAPTGCGSPHWKGDGYCDDENNNPACDLDGGDCCDNTKPYWDYFCKACKCLKPCVKPHWKGDGYCDDENNHDGCDYDGGDCCGNSKPYWDYFCKICKCKE